MSLCPFAIICPVICKPHNCLKRVGLGYFVYIFRPVTHSLHVHLNSCWTPLELLLEASVRSRLVSELHWLLLKRLWLQQQQQQHIPSMWHSSVLLPQMKNRKGRAEEDTSHGNEKAISSQTLDHQQLWKQKKTWGRSGSNKVVQKHTDQHAISSTCPVWLFLSVCCHHNRFICTQAKSSSQAPHVHLITTPLKAFQINRSIKPSIDHFISM